MCKTGGGGYIRRTSKGKLDAGVIHHPRWAFYLLVDLAALSRLGAQPALSAPGNQTVLDQR